MKSGLKFKPLALLFVAVSTLYLIAFHGIEHLRNRQGPWAVTLRPMPLDAPQ